MTVTAQKSDTSPARRPPGINGWLVVGGVLTMMVIVLGGISVAGWLNYRTETQTQVYPTSVADLDVELTTGDLRVVVGADDAVVVTRRLHWSFTKPTFEESFDGRRLTVTQDCEPVFMPGPNCGIDYTIHVPAGTHLRARTKTGDIAVDGVRGAVDLSTSTGDLTVTGVVGDLILHASTGDITVEDALASHVDASTNTGDIAVAMAEQPQTITAGSGTGSVRITVPRGGVYHVQTDIGTGDASVTVHTSDASDRTITVRTGTGDIDIAYE